MNILTGRDKNKETAHLEEKIQSIIDDGEEEGLIDQRSSEMIQSILELKKTVVREVMIPRTEIVAISSDSDVSEIVSLILKYGHTRIPVYEGSVDNIIGILNVKDLLPFWSRSVNKEDILSALRKPYYIPEAKSIHPLLHEMKDKKVHMAIVIDEYGGTSGLVTIEDLIEEIVGEIWDEYDEEEQSFIELSNGEILADARAEIEEFGDFFKVELPEGKFETLGGLIFHLIKKIPVPGESVHFEGLEMTIENADARSIKKVLVKRIGDLSEEISDKGGAVKTKKVENTR